jgi:tetratricopeptide (TPR) repeat protein
MRYPVRTRSAAVVFLAWTAVILTAPQAFGRHIINEGETAPSFSLTERGKTTYRSSAFAGRVALVVFVRPGQDRSRRALREIMAIRESVDASLWECMAIVSGEFTEEAIAELVTSTAFGGRVLLDPRMTVYGTYGVIVTPSTVLVGRDGKVAFAKAGYDYEYASSLDAHLRFTLGLVDAAERDRLIEEGRSAVSPHSGVARLLGLARRLRSLGKLEKAEAAARKAHRENPEAIAARMELAEILLALKRPQEALELVTDVPEGARASGPLRLLRGRALLALGKPAYAEKEFRAAAVRDPRSARAHYELGKLYAQQGKKDEAIAELKQAVEKLLEERE